MNPEKITQITNIDNSIFPDPNYLLGPSMLPSLRSSINQNEGLYQSSLTQVSNMMSSIAHINASDSSTTNQSSTNSDTASLNQAENSSVAQSRSDIKKTIHSPVIQPSKQLILGGVVIPPVPPNSSTATQVHAAAAAAAAAAVPESHDSKKSIKITENLTESQRKRLNRERNKEHAKSTRARKKAYINKLKELVEVLHAEQAEEATTRRVQVQKLADIQRTRRSVLKQFLKYHGGYESNRRKWATILEEDFILKQPVTPYRSFRRSEIENSRDRECRKSVGIDAVIADSASIAVMIDAVGSRSSRWKSIKRDDFLRKEEIRTGKARSIMPHQIDREDSRLHHAISSLSSSSGYSQWFSSANGSGEEEEGKRKHESVKRPLASDNIQDIESNKRGKGCCSSSSGGSGGSPTGQDEVMNTEFHDYNAKPLPDPKLCRRSAYGGNGDNASAGSDSLSENDSDNAVVGAEINTDSSSGDDVNHSRHTRHKIKVPPTLEIVHQSIPDLTNITSSDTRQLSLPTIPEQNAHSSRDRTSISKGSPSQSKLPSNIAQTGGIVHNVKVGSFSSNPRLNAAPAITLPPFTGLGKQSTYIKPNPTNSVSVSMSNSSNSDNALGVATQAKVVPMSNSIQVPSVPQSSSNKQLSNLIGDDNESSSNDSLGSQILAFFHVNEDDMLLTDDVLMCPFIFRTQDAVLCGALAECVMPGMCRAQFSPMNKLISLEMVYDAMGFMQQLGRASGNEGIAEIIPNSLEMSLQPFIDEARVITTAQPPYAIVSANAAWTKITKYSQMEAEQKDLTILEGERTFQGAKNRQGKPSHHLASVSEGKPGCSTNIFYDKYGKTFIAFVSSYPLTNAKNEVTHLLHTFKHLND